MTRFETQEQQDCGIYRRHVGDVAVTLINDGSEEFSFDVLSGGISEDEAKAMLVGASLPPVARMPVHAFVVQDGRRTVLIDAGDANCMGTGGRLQERLAAAQVAASQIDTILLTHAHPDHVGGLVSEDGRPVFGNAELVVHADEVRFWEDDERFRTASAGMLAVRGVAVKAFEAYRPVMRTVMEGEVLPGIEVWPLPGHTPGHSGYVIRSRGDEVLVWGDVVHWPDIQIPRPEVGVNFDIDGEQAVATRRRILEMAARDGLLVAGMHLNFPGFIQIGRTKTGFGIRELE